MAVQRRMLRNIGEITQERKYFDSILLVYNLLPILVINLDTTIAYVNPAFEGATGFSLSELSGRRVFYP